ncbi:MAG: hypothetical protein OZSIB_1351 [Candidatus Ozemobacter sibiricus]|uniref:Uncharacterized protein n=1 Tax=Candidatus Ozemobacter sibiricus TaxID=2268124 RepID=A0A367ZM38_9BACT|nr:MAG: hypothetical protein OZSIB_1351 [Candidatus Ozemobacter sibiricus]
MKDKKTRATLPPGARGTKKLLRKYGNRLLCVRYRYDDRARKRYTTVELIEEEAFWAPPTALVWFRIGPDEVDLQAKARRGGAVWHRDRRLWLMPYRLARALNMPSRIVLDPPPPSPARSPPNVSKERNIFIKK